MITKNLDGNKPILFLGDNHGSWNELSFQIKKNNIIAILKPRTKGSNKYRKEFNSQPPRNIITVNVLIKIIEPYSARKNRAKPILAYSTLKPETNSDSASGKSNGARLVSARIETKNIRNKGKKGIAKTI